MANCLVFNDEQVAGKPIKPEVTYYQHALAPDVVGTVVKHWAGGHAVKTKNTYSLKRLRITRCRQRTAF
jgi:hypothetical protein